MQKLTATAINQAKPEKKTRKLSDGKGLYLEVKPNGSKLWRFKYFFEGKEKLLSLGSYPATTLQAIKSLCKFPLSISNEFTHNKVRANKLLMSVFVK